jgi:PAS domain S-box-containing protein
VSRPAFLRRADWAAFRRGTRGRLFGLVLLILVPALFVQLCGAWSDLRRDIAGREAAVVQVMARAQGDFTSLLEDTRLVFADLVRLNEMRSPENCAQIFNALRLAYQSLAPEATNLGLSDPQGNIYCAVTPVLGNRNIAGQAHFQGAVESLDLALGEYAFHPLTGAPVLAIAYPVLSFNSQVQTVIFVTFELHWLEAWQGAEVLPPGASLTLIAPDGNVLQRYLDGTPVAGNNLAREAAWWPALQAGQRVIEAPDLDGVRRLHTLVPLALDSQPAGYLHLGYPVNEVYANAYRSLQWELALLGLALLAALFLAWWGSEKLFLEPLRSLMRVVGQVQSGDLQARATGVSGLSELLAQSFDRMADALQQREASRQKAQIEQQESEARFRAIFETSAVGIGIMGLDRKIMDVNPALCRIFGLSRQEFIGLAPMAATYPEDYPRSTQGFEDLLSGKSNEHWDERRYVRSNGEVFWAQVTMSLVRNPAGAPLYIVGMVIDIDEQRRMLAELRESEERFRAVFDNTAVGLAVMSLDRHITQINQTATLLTGYTADEMYQLNPSLLAIEEDRLFDRHLFIELIEGKRSQYTVEKRYLRKDGSLFWGRVNFSAVRGADGKPLYTIGMIEDITEEKRAAERLAAQEAEYRRTLEQRVAERTQELNKANELLQQKAAQDAVAAERTRLARELHDAVTQTLFSATLIADVLPELWEMNLAEGRRRLAELHQLTRGALAEMRTLLVELRPNALIDVPLPTLLRQLTESVTGRARINLQLNVDGQRKLPAEVQVAVYRIAQEAAHNIIKHSQATQGMITLRLGDTVRLMVADNGVGFDPSTVTADHLGLKIMRERAEAIGAKFSVYSEPGEGAQISVIWQS